MSKEEIPEEVAKEKIQEFIESQHQNVKEEPTKIAFAIIHAYKNIRDMEDPNVDSPLEILGEALNYAITIEKGVMPDEEEGPSDIGEIEQMLDKCMNYLYDLIFC